jgi:hypothetical protein
MNFVVELNAKTQRRKEGKKEKEERGKAKNCIF